ncbi:RagB/SusD family nutrient uptake outer membrane protein [Parabacteroides gordonii]|uniref:RagB/SusD family nutrient uptake outer membrane protein n=1 Tax=Parabacteroides gordonii TaxID=574930 RepID=UPI00241F0D47|nr:RagB/SusD family nutrient uptake outer membrane protein [Parabacteroides gordonii]
MKHTFIYLFAATSLLCTSCSGDWLNLDPSTSVTTSQAIRTLEEAQIALNGIYRIAASHSYYGDNYLYYADCRGEDVQARISKGPGKRVSPYYEFNVTADDALNITRVWNQPYNVIHQANSLLERIESGEVTTDNTAALDCIKAEALALRGLALFDLTRLFGMPYTLDNGASLGVAIEIKTTLPTHQPARNTVAECYGQAIDDMTEALNLSALSTDKKDGFLNVWSVKALLSRIYLYMNNNEKALALAKEVINNGGLYKLFTHEEYPTVWGKDFNSESLFEFYYTLSEPDGGTGGEGAPMVYADNVKDWNNLVLTKAFLDLLGEDPDDVRHILNRLPQKPEEDILPEGSTGHPKYLNKYPGKTGENPQDNDICVVRLSEVYLNAAEAAFKLGGAENLAFSLDCLNAIVSRANPAKSVQASELSLERILKERRKELVGEGHAFFDAMRNGLPVTRTGGWHLPSVAGAAVITPSDLRVALPIPQTEIDANPNMVQNPR